MNFGSLLKRWLVLGIGYGVVWSFIFGLLFLFVPSWLGIIPMLPQSLATALVGAFILGMITYVILTAIRFMFAGLIAYFTSPILRKLKVPYEFEIWVPITIMSFLFTIIVALSLNATVAPSGGLYSINIMAWLLMAVAELVSLYIAVPILRAVKYLPSY